MKTMPSQEKEKEVDNTSRILVLVLITTLASCGLMLPVWLFIGIMALILRIIRPKPEPKKPVDIPVSNEFASDWVYEIRN
jgi:hypothetical protein